MVWVRDNQDGLGVGQPGWFGCGTTRIVWMWTTTKQDGLGVGQINALVNFPCELKNVCFYDLSRLRLKEDKKNRGFLEMRFSMVKSMIF